ncbi:MAG: hypothetical protein HY262_12545 [Chloroflexi bacterium]|nr:hypothetical protein [Chloroflexota bacterium]
MHDDLRRLNGGADGARSRHRLDRRHFSGQAHPFHACVSAGRPKIGQLDETAPEVRTMHDHGPVRTARPETVAPVQPAVDEDGRPAPSHSMWWMVACCAPMVVLALALLLGVFLSR